MKHLHKDVLEIRKELSVIKNILFENYELSDKAKAELAEARKTPRLKYISHEEVKKRVLE